MSWGEAPQGTFRPYQTHLSRSRGSLSPAEGRSAAWEPRQRLDSPLGAGYPERSSPVGLFGWV